MNKPKCDAKTIKTVLLVFNSFFIFSGLILITLGGLIIYEHDAFVDFVGGSVATVVPIVLMILGGAITLISGFGFWALIAENYYGITIYSLFLTMVMIAELCVGALIYGNQNKVAVYLNENIPKSLDKYLEDESIQQLWNLTQNYFECCGADNYSDWQRVFNDTLIWPNSCCGDKNDKCNPNMTSFRFQGCLKVIINWTKGRLLLVAGLSFGIAFILTGLGVIFTCWLAIEVQQNDEISLD